LEDGWVLVLGAGYWQIPLIKTVQRLGYRALAIDRNPDAEGGKVADRFEAVDITDAESAVELGKSTGITGAVSDQTDLSVPALARICEALDLPGPSPETAHNTTNKARMRLLAGEAGLENPSYRVCASIDEAVSAIDEDHPDAPGGVGIPCVVKPTDSQASRGVQLIEHRKDIRPAAEEALGFSREGRILVEEYLVGREVTVEGCRYAGETHLLGISTKRHTPPPHILAMNLDFPAQLPPDRIEEIHGVYERLVDALGIEAGSIHGELIVTDDGIYLIEMANRGGGSGTSSHCIPAISGVDLLEANVRYAVGDERRVVRTKDRAGVLRFFLFPPGRVNNIEGVEKASNLDGVVNFVMYIKPGDKLVPPVMDTQRHACLITVGDTLDEAKRIADEVERMVAVNYSEG